ncbi:protein FAR1-RELATED SEQUENCE 5-like [Tripterygium wilfordii]|uniref:protein FAR1-RELATED SEQUENCE 5-like n=1 Tax=Tripterygium wilfordii TaxID=458696 RepID=UPI0018F830FD|nr:protein FAR1-RELATED SEQUENCE 5-like [Tripterygium wilfordii]
MKNFVEEHNHELEPPETHHMIRSYREVSASYGLAIELASDSGLTPRATHELLCKEAGGGQNLGSSWKIKRVICDQERKKIWHMVSWEILMIVDYIDFGDVLTFDTTYDTNKELRPLGAFVGFNHHRQMMIFGGALMYDETADSFAWLFETFLKAHDGKRPQTVFIDQDVAMLNALQRVWPDTRHGLCIWHLNQNGIKRLDW